jgi:pimeloyl-ACP methyl ester carboxylesterase
VDILGKSDKRHIGDVERYLAAGGIPVEGKDELLMIPPFIIKIMFFLARVNRVLRPNYPYDTPFLPFNLRAGHMFLTEYDSDFSRATLDGDLSKDFDPEEALKNVKCPMLLLRASAYRHATWGLVGAIDDDDLERIKTLVSNLQVVDFPGGHEIHMIQPTRYIDETINFIDNLIEENKLSLK